MSLIEGQQDPDAMGPISHFSLHFQHKCCSSNCFSKLEWSLKINLVSHWEWSFIARRLLSEKPFQYLRNLSHQNLTHSACGVHRGPKAAWWHLPVAQWHLTNSWWHWLPANWHWSVTQLKPISAVLGQGVGYTCVTEWLADVNEQLADVTTQSMA